LDYVTAWYILAGQYIQKTNIKVAFVSTNSICQGEQAFSLWHYLVESCCLQINFAYKHLSGKMKLKIKRLFIVLLLGWDA
jgi:hypothetical protein